MKLSLDATSITMESECVTEAFVMGCFSARPFMARAAEINGKTAIVFTLLPTPKKAHIANHYRTLPCIRVPKNHNCHNCKHLPKKEASTYCGKVKKYRKFATRTCEQKEIDAKL